jgi:hypothetical protein
VTSKPLADWTTAIVNMSGRTAADIAEIYSERAGVREYCGGMGRAEAEREARKDVEGMVLGGE